MVSHSASLFSMERIITIQGLSVLSYVGVPSEEREQAQRLSFDLRFAALLQPATLNDDIVATVDYAAVSQRLVELVQMRSRRLIETLADEIAEALLAEFSLRWVEVTVRKFILPNTEHVAVTVCREK
ncbi:MAG: dihydroneopterin aldolase [Verrucomicrobiae bacterium]|nr:dihydroneopterin aldolase [Verrucomicrobiae bacterium]